jgi:hypothetical protein
MSEDTKLPPITQFNQLTWNVPPVQVTPQFQTYFPNFNKKPETILKLPLIPQPLQNVQQKPVTKPAGGGGFNFFRRILNQDVEPFANTKRTAEEEEEEPEVVKSEQDLKAEGKKSEMLQEAENDKEGHLLPLGIQINDIKNLTLLKPPRLRMFIVNEESSERTELFTTDAAENGLQDSSWGWEFGSLHELKRLRGKKGQHGLIELFHYTTPDGQVTSTIAYGQVTLFKLHNDEPFGN